MSYILDALRKADAQRERDASRGIHAHPASIAADDSQGSPASRAGWMVLIAGVVVAAIAAGWYLTKGDAGVPPEARMTAPPTTPPVTSNATTAGDTPPVAATVISPPPAPPAALRPPTPAAVQAREAAFASQVQPPPAQTAQANPLAQGGQGGPGAQVPQVPQAGVPGASPAAPGAPVAGGLPPDAPRVTISGGVYSPNAAQRMLIVNGQVYNEGSEVAPGLKVEAIQPRTAILSFRGTRYTVAY